jgi:predicted nucleic acid-binding protein
LTDTQIMIDCTRGHSPATSFFIAMNWNIKVRLSRLTVAEILAGRRADAERAIAIRLIGYSTVLDLTDAIAQRAVALLTAVPLPTPLAASDAVVAATAIEHSLPLDTLDPGRLAAVPGLATAKPY